jgi:tetratricopeptide (TPR) repeat protein
LLKSTNRLLEARSVIASALEGFTPTPEFPAIAETQTLLGELEQSDLFRQDQRNRASYARALLAVEGYVSRAAQAAFQRAGGSEEGHFDDPQFQKLFYGHCLRLLAAGELFEGLEYAEAQLRRVPEGARSLFVPLARRLIAHFLFNLGRLGRARDELERAKADFDPDWAQAYLAVTPHDFTNATDYLLANIEWIAGDIDGALARATETRRRAEERGEPFTLAIVLSFLATLYYMADRAQETLEVSEVLAEVTSAHGISFYGRLGAVTLSWAKGRLGDPRDAIRAVRTAIDLRSQNGEGYFQSLALAQLSHLQILADDVEGALAALDEASAFVARTGETVGLARLLTLRGDCLLPSDTVAAEEAYRRALCVAREQGARTFELKASLPLARLQADKRSMEARDILARALEGFAPSSELPEIAEAQNLLREL